jgi:Domain of unknown function (DUF1707)/Domain of unknown function (DUF4190)
MMAGIGNAKAEDQHGKLRAADTDRDHVAEVLGTAYSEGRLSKDEYDARLEAAFTARTYADLDRVLTDLPARPEAALATESPGTGLAARTNVFAIASLVCGLGQFIVGPLATIPAIVFGHMARHQVRRTGEGGAGLALAGLVLGWGAVILAIAVILIATVAVATGAHGTMRMP